MLRSVVWYFVTEVSGQIIGTIFKGQAVQVYFFDINKCFMFMEPGFTVLVRPCQGYPMPVASNAHSNTR